MLDTVGSGANPQQARSIPAPFGNSRDTEEHNEPPPYSENDTLGATGRNVRLPSYAVLSQTSSSSDTRCESHERDTTEGMNESLETCQEKPKRKSRRTLILVLVVICCLAGAVFGGVFGSVLRPPSTSSTTYEVPFDVDELSQSRTHMISELYTGDNFFDAFDFYTTSNESYDTLLVGETRARDQGIIRIQDSNAVVSVSDNATVRLVSKQSWSSGIFAFEISTFSYHCRFSPSIRLARSADALSNNVFTLFQSFIGLYTEEKGTADGWFSGYRTPQNESCIANVIYPAPRSGNTNYECHGQNSRDSPLNCGYVFGSYVSSSYLLHFVELNAEEKRMSVWNSMYTDGWREKDWVRQLDASAIDRTRLSWQDSDVELTFDDNCNIDEIFKELKLVFSLDLCGDYGRYNAYSYGVPTTFVDGDWCEQTCNPTYTTRDGDWLPSPKWSIKRVAVYQPV